MGSDIAIDIYKDSEVLSGIDLTIGEAEKLLYELGLAIKEAKNLSEELNNN